MTYAAYQGSGEFLAHEKTADEAIDRACALLGDLTTDEIDTREARAEDDQGRVYCRECSPALADLFSIDGQPPYAVSMHDGRLVTVAESDAE